MKRVDRKLQNANRRLQNERIAGFTLLEIVLALGLTSLLLVAVYGALQMHWTYSTMGQIEMERSQVARSLFRRIETDLRAAVLSATASSASDDASSGTSAGSTSTSGSTTGTTGSSTTGSSTSTGTTSTSISTDTSGTSTSTDSTQTAAAQKQGIYGDSQNLIIHASLPSKATSSWTNTSGTSPISDVQSVAYFLAGSSSTLGQQFADQLIIPAGTPLSLTGQASGLARLQGDRLALDSADQTTGIAASSTKAYLLAPEVASIEFEYYDGTTWTTTWDTGTSAMLPNAVRVTINFSPPPNPTGGWFARPVNPSTNTYQHTIALPLAEPYIGASSL